MRNFNTKYHEKIIIIILILLLYICCYTYGGDESSLSEISEHRPLFENSILLNNNDDASSTIHTAPKRTMKSGITQHPPSIPYRSSEPQVFLKNHNDSHKTNHRDRDRDNHRTLASASSEEAIIVCAVDGTIYTLDAWTGQLRGLFSTGGSLIDSSSSSTAHRRSSQTSRNQYSAASSSSSTTNYNEENENYRNYDYDHNIIHDTIDGEEIIIPGLDGYLYSMQESNGYVLNKLPIDVSEVVHAPISVCRSTASTSSSFDWDIHHDGYLDKNYHEQEQCGLVTAQKRTKIYAMDVYSGKVRWVQDSKDGGTNTMSGSSSSTSGGFHRFGTMNHGEKGKTTILLQREDYDVREVDIDTGDEIWRVKMGKVLPLEFKRSTAGNDMRRKSENTNTSHRGNLPIPSRFKESIYRTKTRQPTTHHTNGDEEVNEDFRSNEFISFPSIAFGNDGTSLMAVDSNSGTLLWKRRIESMVATVYGVGKGSSWVALEVIDGGDYENKNDDDVRNESKLLLTTTDGRNENALALFHDPTISNNFVATLPLVTYNTEKNRQHAYPWDFQNQISRVNNKRNIIGAKVAKHYSSVFVASIFEIDKQNRNQQLLIANGNEALEQNGDQFQDEYNDEYNDYDDEEDEDDYYYSDEYQIDFDHDMDHYISLYNNFLNTSRMSHKTEHGLFLTWGMVTALVSCILIGVLGGRYVYLRKKKRWILESSPGVAEEFRLQGRLRSTPTEMSLGLGDPLSQLSLGRAHTDEDTKINYTTTNFTSPSPIFRSTSLPQLNGYFRGHIEKTGSEIYRDDIKSAIPSATSDTIPASTTTSQKENRNENLTDTSQTATYEPKLVNDDLNGKDRRPRSSSLEGVSNIDGIPLIRYSRYRSEFNQLERLGEGGFGTVYKCVNALDGREYAIKKVLIKSSVDSRDQIPKQFTQKLHKVLREVKNLALLDHPNIVRYYTAWLEVEAFDSDQDNEVTSIGNSIESDYDKTNSYSTGFLAGNTTSQSPKSPRRRWNQTSFSPSHGFNKSVPNPLGLECPRFDELSERIDTKRPMLLSESKQSSSSFTGSEDDLGFTWERSSSGIFNQGKVSMEKKKSLPTIEDSRPLNGNSDSDSSDSSNESNIDSSTESEAKWLSKSISKIQNEKSSGKDLVSTRDIQSHYDSEPTANNDCPSAQKLFLYIQMQLSKKTLLDYFVARIQSKTKNVDIPAALRIFVHIARGVKHVHAQGLIHRDLKPSNCFMDDSELIKIGDFGLSRESGSNGDDIQNQGSEFILDNDVIETKQDITAGVGTTTYVSPEQKIGSDYDASTDVFSLGIILFELCYPMLTGMERMMVFSSIRKQKFPTDWNNTVAKQFPSIHKLIKDMLSHDPKSRPSSAEVTKKIELLLSEYTVLSLDQITRLDGSKESNIFLRVEAVYNDGILARTIKLIKDSSPHVIVSQYSLRGQETKAIMEFALSIKNSIDHSLDTKEIIRNVFVSLEEDEDITIVREVKRQDNVETHQST